MRCGATEPSLPTSCHRDRLRTLQEAQMFCLSREAPPLLHEAGSEGNARRRPLGGCEQCGVTELPPEPVTPPSGLLPALTLSGWHNLLRVNWDACITLDVYEFPTPTVTNCHEFRGLKQHKCILFWFWRSEIRNHFHGADVKVWTRALPSAGAIGESASLPFSVSADTCIP